MTSFGLLFILAGLLLTRQVVVGRVKETPSDMRDLGLAVLNGDTAAMQAVLSARGQNVDVGSPGTEVAATVDDPTSTQNFTGNTALAAKAVSLGNAAQGYALGGTGPHYYDCSGLIYQAAKQTGVYNGVRFTSSSFEAIAPTFCTKVTAPANGDIALWPGHHMGVVIGTDKLYSARSKSKGIGISSISTDAAYFGSQPQYWRVNA